MDTEEMFRRGVADAEKGDPHPFYYEHYYQYRRGYDRARRQMGLPGGIYDRRRRRLARLALVIGALLVVAAVVFFWRGRGAPATVGSASTAPALAASTTAPTRTPLFPTPTPAPTAVPALHVGGSATVVNTQGAPLRGRKQPSVKAAITANFREGERVGIAEGPVQADGFIWWRVTGANSAGWSAERSKDGVIWLQPLADQ